MKKARATPYDRVSKRLAEVDPADSIESAVARRVHDRVRSKRTARLAQKLMNALPTRSDRERWFLWEELAGARAHLNDRALFDLGYEFGRADELAARNGADAGQAAIARVHAALRAEGLDEVDAIRTLLIVALATLSQSTVSDPE